MMRLLCGTRHVICCVSTFCDSAQDMHSEVRRRAAARDQMARDRAVAEHARVADALRGDGSDGAPDED